MSKYNNRKVNAYGKTFDSKKEARRYGELLILEKTGVIHDIRTQVPYELIPSQFAPGVKLKSGKTKRGKLIERAVTYKADFVYKNALDEEIVEDTKGFKTKEYIIKRKLMLWVHGIQIREV